MGMEMKLIGDHACGNDRNCNADDDNDADGDDCDRDNDDDGHVNAGDAEERRADESFDTSSQRTRPSSPHTSAPTLQTSSSFMIATLLHHQQDHFTFRVAPLLPSTHATVACFLRILVIAGRGSRVQ